ncbi:MAG: hypothetical protein E7256_15445 [Lachnospiraceae bacterium]|nr:hypothetical protein [Lachnospiraceae bacterium]
MKRSLDCMKRFFKYIKSIQDIIRKQVRWWQIIVLYLMQIAVFQVMQHVTFPVIEKNLGTLKIFDMTKQGYGLADAYEIIDRMGTEGIHMYLHVQMPLDFLYPVLMAVVYCLVLVKTSTKPRYSYVLVPGFLVLLDWSENLCIIRMLAERAFSTGLVRFSSFCTCAKAVVGDYILYFATLFGIAVCLLRWVNDRFSIFTRIHTLYKKEKQS